jgi:hypothetical protein
MRLRSFARRRQGRLTVLGSLITAAILVLLLAGRRDEFVTALSSAPAWVLVVTVLLQVVALVTLGQLPIGPAVGAAAAVLILGSDGVAAAAAAGCSRRSPARSAASVLPPGPAPITCGPPW